MTREALPLSSRRIGSPIHAPLVRAERGVLSLEPVERADRGVVPVSRRGVGDGYRKEEP